MAQVIIDFRAVARLVCAKLETGLSGLATVKAPGEQPPEVVAGSTPWLQLAGVAVDKENKSTGADSDDYADITFFLTLCVPDPAERMDVYRVFTILSNVNKSLVDTMPITGSNHTVEVTRVQMQPQAAPEHTPVGQWYTITVTAWATRSTGQSFEAGAT